MISVSNDYKSAITEPRQIDAKIIVGLNTITSDDINQIKRSFNTSLFKTVAKMVEIDSNTTIAKGTTIEPKFGLYINGAFEYASLGLYKVRNDPNLKKDTNSYEITAYDEIVESMVNYELTDSDISYPCTVKEMFEAIFTKLGWSTTGIPASFTNSTSQIEEDVYSNVDMTYRDVLDELCTISCMFLIDDNGAPKLIEKTTTSETIDDDFFSDTNVDINEEVFFNSLVFSRAGESDNIVRKDDVSIASNGLHEFKIKDLQILSMPWRDNFIDEMWTYLQSFSYYAFDTNTMGITYLEPIDDFTISIFGDTYSTILLNSDLTIGGGVNEKIYSKAPEETETDYKYSSDYDKKLNQTSLIVDKQKNQIEALVSSTKIISNEITSSNSLQLENAYVGTLHYLSIKGNLQPIMPSNTLYPSDDLFILDTYLLVDTTEYKLDIDKLNYISEEVCDEFVYEDGKCKIIRRVGVDGNGDLYALEEESVEVREDVLIEVKSNSILRMKQYNNLIYTCSYLVNNDYTDTFAPTVDLIAKINLSEGKATIQANKVSLEGKTIDLTSDRIKIQSKNFNVDEDGNMIANSGTFGGTISTAKDCTVGDDLYVGQNQNDQYYYRKNIYFSNNVAISRAVIGNSEVLGLVAPYLNITGRKKITMAYDVDDTLYNALELDNNNFRLHTNYDNTYIEGVSGAIYMSHQPTINSDKRLKTNIKNLDTNWINDLKVKEFEYKNSLGNKQIGLIAQDYENKDYNKYFLNKKENGYYAINYGNITNALIDYCQNLNKRIEELEEKINKMDGDK